MTEFHRDEQLQRLTAENKQLRLSKAHYQTMFEHSKVAIWEEDFSEVIAALRNLSISSEKELDQYLAADPNRVFDIIGRAQVNDVNPATIKLVHARSKDELLGSIDKVIVPHTLPFLHKELIALWKGERYFEGETINQTMDGQLLHLLVSISILDTEDSARHVLVSMMDITDRIRKEQHQSKLLAEIQEKHLYAEIMQEITIALTSQVKRDSLLDTIFEQLQRLVEYTSGNIRMLRGDNVEIVRAYGYEEMGAGDFIKELEMPLEKFILAKQVLQTKRPIIIHNTKKDPRWTTYPETDYIHSIILLPIYTRTKIYGLLSVEHKTVGAYNRATAEKLIPFAHAAALAFSRSELYEQLNSELEAKQQIQEELAASLEQKDTLLKEIHHRIKNNLSLVSSLINLQSFRTEDEAVKELLEHLRGKILSISLVHEKLYRSSDFQDVSLREYVSDLLNSLETTAPVSKLIQTEVVIDEEVTLDTNTLIPTGLILTELFTNSVKYVSPPEGSPVEFRVEAHTNAEGLSLLVRDNGPGIPSVSGGALKDIASSDGIGLTLVENLVEQIDGTLEIEPPPGFRLKLELPL
ncbi:MAG: histidine kinase dimerization/phosphoacceptor domain -containing protein [bacterium]